MKQKGATALKAKSGASVYVISIIFAALLLSIHSIYLVLIILFGILPAMVAILIDQEERKYISKIVLAFNLMGLIPYVIRILRGKGLSDSVAIDIMVEPVTWMIIYGYAAIGWLVYWLIPELGQIVNDWIINSKIHKLNDKIDVLSSEWGDEIKN